MIRLTKWQVYLKKIERQMVDLLLAGRLWQLYEMETDLFQTLQDMCGVGAGITLEFIDLAAAAMAIPGNFYSWESDRNFDSRDALKGKAGLKPIFKNCLQFLDCFENKPVTKAVFERMRDQPRKIFTDMGKVGGYLRGHAEMSEALCQLVLDENGERKNPRTVLDRMIETRRREALVNTRLMSQRQEAVYQLLSREYEGRLSHQAKLERRRIVVVSKEGLKTEQITYSNVLFSKWKDWVDYETTQKEVETTYQRARSGVRGEKIPQILRPFIKVPTHLKGTYDWTSGITKWKQADWDRMWLISQLYGLPPGATISGTTTDHMFGIHEILTYCENQSKPSMPEGHIKAKARRIARAMNGYLPYLYLVPLIQMVPQMHHSLAETGAALSLNDFISYHVGYYTTLLRPEAKGLQPTLYKKVMRLLKEAEGAVCHMYVASDDGSPASLKTGGYAVNMSDLEEVKKHKKAALLNPETVVAKFMSIPSTITIKYAHSKAKAINPNIPNLTRYRRK